MTKEEMLSEIRRTATENGGLPLGMKTFEYQTGIRKHDWSGVYWRSWGDALREAGFKANTLTPRIPDEQLLERYALLTRELRRVPVSVDLQMAKRRDATFPSDESFSRRFGSYANIRSRVREWCSDRSDFADVSSILGQSVEVRRSEPVTPSSVSLGYVYLVKHGSRSEFKIGRTQNAIRREGEIRLQLPEKVTPIHYIATDDPAGVESYWHTRFAAKRKEGEWFKLNADDVRAFKKWKRIS
jgi:hypothetical protein